MILAARQTMSTKEDKSVALEETLKELKKDIDRRFEEIRAKLDDTLEQGRAAVRERPLVSLGAAFAIGIIIDVLLGRKSKD